MDFLLSFLPQELSSGLATFLALLTLLFYVAESLSGYKLIRSWISILGFLIGAFVGFRLLSMFVDQVGYVLLGAILCGVLLSILSYRIYLVGVFLIAGFGVFQIGMACLPLKGGFLLIVSVLLGFIAAYLAIKFMRPAIILITAFHGGIMAATLLPQFIALPDGWTTLTFGLVIGAVGTAIQFLTTKK